MRVRSSSSSVHTWPDAGSVLSALRCWAAAVACARKDVSAIGCFGSYARGDSGFGSDLDLVVLVDESERPFVERALEFDTLPLPVPVDLLVYTLAEWRALMAAGGRFARTLETECLWVYRRENAAADAG